MRPHSQTWLNVSIGLLLSLVIVNGGVTYRNIRQLREDADLVAHTHEVLEVLERTISTVRNAETGKRGYMLTGDESYLEPYQDAIPRSQHELAELKSLLADYPRLLTQHSLLEELIQTKLNELASAVEMHRSGDPAGARELVLTNHGQRTMQRIRALVDDMAEEERRLLVERESQDDRAYRSAVLGVVVSAIAGLAGLLVLLLLLRRRVRRTNDLLRELKAGEELFHTMADSIPQLAWMARSDGHIYWYNKRWYEYTGATLAEMEGWGWQSVHDPEELPRVLAGWKAALAKGQPWEDTFPIRRHDGAMRWHLSRAEPVRNQQGEITYWFGTNTDITEQQEMEEALREDHRRKDEFLATLAHELRNPIAPISNALQIWPLVENDPEEVARLRAIMEPQVRQMNRLIDDLLDVSRITQGKIQLRRQPVELSAIVTSAIDVIRPIVDSCGHRLEVEMADEPLVVYGDATRLTQVLDNLLQNAAKYTNPGGNIRITALRQEGEAVISIQDSGVGISRHMLHRIFEVFQQGDQTIDRLQGGLGLGLTLVKRLVELHAGTVEAESDGEGKGSTFIVRLPISKARLSAGDQPDSPSSRDRASDLARHRILVVDDVRASAKTLAMMLDRIGQEVTIAHDGSAAVEHVVAHRPDVVFLDIAMPGMNGYDVAQQLRASEHTAQVVLVALTGYGDEESRRKSREAGFDHHLTKPTSIDQLSELLRALGPVKRDRQSSAPVAD